MHRNNLLAVALVGPLLASVSPAPAGAIPAQSVGEVYVYLPVLAQRVPLRTLGQAFAPSVAGYAGIRYRMSNFGADEFVHAVAVDGHGVAWIGTDSGAVALAPDGGANTYTTFQGLPADDVSDIAIDRHGDPWAAGNLWYLGRERYGWWGAFGWFNGTTWITWRNTGDFRDGRIDVVHAIAVDAGDDKWFATEPWWGETTHGGELRGEGGVYRMRGRTYEERSFEAWTVVDGVSLVHSTDVSVDARGSTWVITEEGNLVRRGPDGHWHAETSAQGRPGTFVSSIAVDPATDALWVAASEALAVRTPDGQWQVVPGPEGAQAPAAAAVAMAIDRRGNLWYGNYVENTMPGGVRFADGRWHAFTAADGPIAKDTEDIFAAVDGSVWFATREGAVVLRAKP